MATLGEINAKIAALQRELDATVALAQTQKEERDELIAERKKLVRATSISDFPPEILHKIFQHALSDRVFDHRTERFRTNIRLVSSHWDRIMLSDPAFWTSIFISFLTDHTACIEFEEEGKPFQDQWAEVPDLLTTAEEALERIRRRIAHSRGHPLDLRLFYVAGGMGVCDEPPPGLARLIQGKNFRSISIELHHDLDDYTHFPFDLFQPRRRLPASTCARLQSLHLKFIVEECFDGVRDRPPYDGIPTLLLTTAAFPALRHVALELPRADLLKWVLPWEQLVSLKLLCFRNASADYLPILGKSRILQELHIHVDLPNRREPLDSSGVVIGADRLVTLTQLHTLVLQVDIKCNMLTAFIPKLVLPRLRTLKYHNMIDWASILWNL